MMRDLIVVLMYPVDWFDCFVHKIFGTKNLQKPLQLICKMKKIFSLTVYLLKI